LEGRLSQDGRQRRGNASAASRIRGVVSGIAVDLTPLRRSHDFRLLFSGQSVSLIGSQFTIVAVPFQVFQITHSSLAVGLLAFTQLVPMLLFSLLGGSLADILDRRRVLMVTNSLLFVTSGTLGAAAFLGHTPLWFLFTIPALAACVTAVAQPTYRAVIPRLVARDQMTSGMALNQLLNQTGRVAGAALAGLVLAALGVRWSYTLDSLTFLAAIAALWRMSPIPADDGGTLRDRFKAIGEGLDYLRQHPVLMSTFLVDLNATIFGGPTALYPALALTVFKVGPGGLGLLYAAPGAGAFIGACLTGWAKDVRRQGRATVLLICVWGAAITAFGLVTHWFALGLLFLGIAGAADTWSALFRSAMLQLALPDRLRGRISAVHFMSVTGGPRLGALESGAVASLTNVQFSVISGGLASIVGALIIGALVPAYLRYDAHKAVTEAPAV